MTVQDHAVVSGDARIKVHVGPIIQCHIGGNVMKIFLAEDLAHAIAWWWEEIFS